MRSRSFGLVLVMGSFLEKLRLYFEKMNQEEDSKMEAKASENKAKANVQKSSVEKTRECKPSDEAIATKTTKRRTRATVEEMKEAREKMVTLEGQLTTQRTLMQEHQAKMKMLEQLIQRQCLVLKESDDKCSYEQLAKSSDTPVTDTQSFWERIENQLSSMLEKKGYDEGGDDGASLAKIKHQFDAQRQQLQEHGQCIKKHEEQFEDQLARIEMMREILDENSNQIGSENSVRLILDDHERRLNALEDRMAVYEKQVERRLAEQHQLLIFTWLGLITTFVLCFAIVCSCCWFR